MAAGNAVVVNFSGGETSPRSRGRIDQPWYQTSAKKMLNFIAELQGSARFRPGFLFSFQTRQGQAGRLLDFEINDNLAYLLEFTPGFLRVRNPVTYQLLTTTQATITGVTKANPAVVTVASATGLSNGKEVVLSGMVGMPQLNNKQFLIANLSGSTFNLQDPVTGTNLDTSAYPAAATGGVAAVVYELATPYSALDLQSLQAAATDGRMYLVCPRQAPQKLTVDATGNFLISSYVRINDPFALASTTTTVIGVGPFYVRDQRDQNGTITPGATSGSGITFTSSQSIFLATDVGKYIEKVPMGASDTGYGRAIITGVTSSQQVTVNVLTAFDSTSAIAAGDWFITTVETIVQFSGSPVVNSTLSYLFSGVGGATQINGNSYLLLPFDTPGTTSPRYVLRTLVNAAVDSSAWGIYTSGGSATVTSSQPTLTVTGITLGTKTIVTFASGSSINPNVGYAFSGVGGTTQINGQTYWLKTEADGVHITLVDGTEVNSTTWSNYTSGGIATAQAEYPLTVTFYEGRLMFGGTNQRPDCLFGSRSPDSNGNQRYDDFTGGSNADFACFFQLAPTGGSASFISWSRGGPDYLFIGTFGGPYRVSGSGLDIPITPSSINVRQFDTAGAEETMPAGLQQLFFIQRAGVSLRSIKVINPYLATFDSVDLCLNAEQVGYSPLQRVVLQHGRPDSLWVVRADGKLFGMSVKITQQQADTLTGWHPHKIGGGGLVQDVAIIPRQTGLDQVWIMVQRVVNGAKRCYVEIMADDVYFPDLEDFWASSGSVLSDISDDPNQAMAVDVDGSRSADLANWQNALWRRQDEYVHMDSAVTYDGSARGTAAGATLTPSAVGAPQVEGQAAVPITLTASAAVFSASDVGSEIWVKPNLITGLGAGRAKITAFTSSTQVSAVVSVPFSSTQPFAAGDWYFAVSTFYGLGHLEGQQVAVLLDGSVLTDGGQTDEEDFPDLIVAQGSIAIPQPNTGIALLAAVAHIGLPYMGLLVTHNLDMGGRTGPAVSKARNIAEINARFLSTLGVEYGTDFYDMQKIEHRLSDAVMDRPAPVFSGVRRLKLEDDWTGLTDATREKNVVICQRLPLPAVVEALDLWYDTAEEGVVA